MTTTEEIVVARTMQLISDRLHEIGSEYQSKLKHGDIIKYGGREYIVVSPDSSGDIVVKKDISHTSGIALDPIDVAVMTSCDEDLKDLYSIWLAGVIGNDAVVSAGNTKYQQYVAEARHQLTSEIVQTACNPTK